MQGTTPDPRRVSANFYAEGNPMIRGGQNDQARPLPVPVSAAAPFVSGSPLIGSRRRIQASSPGQAQPSVVAPRSPRESSETRTTGVFGNLIPQEELIKDGKPGHVPGDKITLEEIYRQFSVEQDPQHPLNRVLLSLRNLIMQARVSLKKKDWVEFNSEKGNFDESVKLFQEAIAQRERFIIEESEIASQAPRSVC